MSLAFYRKYRPQTFAEIVGQEYIVQTLTNAIPMGLISHAYLFSGPRGSGKTTLARLFAKAVNCQNRKENEFEPCLKCSSCLEIKEGNAMDLIEIDAASHRGIDEMKELRNKIGFLPAKSKYKIFIIDESHQLTKEAANALLKTLEEPPSHVIFILATTEAYKMIPTIASRCQRFDFKKLIIQDIIKKLKLIAGGEKIDFDEQALLLIAQNSEGSLRDAESLMDQCISFLGQERQISVKNIKDLLGILEVSKISEFVDCLLEKNPSKAITFLEEQISQGLNLEEFVKSIISYLRKTFFLKINTQSLSPDSFGFTPEEFKKTSLQAEKFEEKKLEKLLETLVETEYKMKYASIPQLPLELAIVKATTNNQQPTTNN